MDFQEARASVLIAHPDYTDEQADMLATRISATPYERALAEAKAAAARQELAEAKEYEARVKAGPLTAEQVAEQAAALKEAMVGQSGRDFLRPEVIGVEHSREHIPVRDDLSHTSAHRKAK